MKTNKNFSKAGLIEHLEQLRRLLELKGENIFKIRAFEKAVGIVDGVSDLESRIHEKTLTDIPGIGKGISEVITDFYHSGTSKTLSEIEKNLPVGLLDLTQVPGLGPKKAMVLIEELGIHSIAELAYACTENRLVQLKGFGQKVQDKILEGVRFLQANQGQARLGDVLPWVNQFLEKNPDLHETGMLRRRREVLSQLDFIEVKASKKSPRTFEGAPLPVEIHTSTLETFGYDHAHTTATPEHWKALGSPKKFSAKTEVEFYQKLKLDWIQPECRETGEEVSWAKEKKLQNLLPLSGVQGIFHNHTRYSDGSATVEEMVKRAFELGYRYIGISDHSQSAFYAQGLKSDALLKQQKEIQSVQKKYPQIKIYWGIESDILADGSLDYPAMELKRFDFVIASVHSRFQMGKSEMTERILTAIRNPYTRFLGHSTGRLLLGRKEYEVDMDAIIEEAAKKNVAIELNSNPQRLDIDWRYGPILRKNKTKIAINPDAHSLEGLEDTRYGEWMARKALIPTSQILNAGSVSEVDAWLQRK